MPKAGAGTKEPTPPGAEDVPVKGEQSKPSSLGALPTLDQGKEYVNGLWWGKEGSGKTTDVMTAANHGRILVVNAESGLKKKPLADFGIDLQNIVPWPADADREQLMTYDGLDSLFWQLKADLVADPESWYAVVFDSFSEIYTTFVRNEVTRQYEKNKTLPVARQKEYREDEFFTDRSDYGVATDQLRVLLRKFRDLPCHFLATALERRDVDEDTSTVSYGPAVGPALQTSLLGYMDVNIHCEAAILEVGPDPDTDAVDTFIGLTRPDGKNRAKDRFRTLPRRMANPTFDRVHAYLEEQVLPDDDPVQKEYLATRQAARAESDRRKEERAARKAAARS